MLTLITEGIDSAEKKKTKQEMIIACVISVLLTAHIYVVVTHTQLARVLELMDFQCKRSFHESITVSQSRRSCDLIKTFKCALPDAQSANL